MAQIKNYEDYDITESGEVISHKYNKQRVLKLQKATQSKKGYYQVRLFNEFTPAGRLQYVHRLVWENFVGEIPEGMEIDHKDNDTSNNNISNLQLVTKAENLIKNQLDKHGFSLRDRRDEIIEDYIELGSFELVANKWNTHQTVIHRIIKNKKSARIRGKKLVYTSNTFDVNLTDIWTTSNLKSAEVRKELGLPPIDKRRKK